MKTSGHQIPFCGQKLSESCGLSVSMLCELGEVKLFNDLFLIQQTKLSFSTHTHRSVPGRISVFLKGIKNRFPEIKKLPVYLEGKEKIKSQTK